MLSNQEIENLHAGARHLAETRDRALATALGCSLEEILLRRQAAEDPLNVGVDQPCNLVALRVRQAFGKAALLSYRHFQAYADRHVADARELASTKWYNRKATIAKILARQKEKPSINPGLTAFDEAYTLLCRALAERDKQRVLK